MKRFGFHMLMGITLCGTALLPSALGQEKGKVIPAAARSTEFDQPIAWLQEAKRNYSIVKDYTCTMVSQERVAGKLQEQNVISFKMKTEPFSVYMRWIGEGKKQGQEVAFVHGKNNNKMRVKSPLFKWVWMSVDVNDKRVLEHSRHTILEAGIGNMIEQHITQWQNDAAIGKSKLTPIAEHVYAGRKCYKVEVIRAEDPRLYCKRTVLYLEKESKMPIRLENYDWNGDLLEMFGYVNLQFNTGLKASDFER